MPSATSRNRNSIDPGLGRFQTARVAASMSRHRLLETVAVAVERRHPPMEVVRATRAKSTTDLGVGMTVAGLLRSPGWPVRRRTRGRCPAREACDCVLAVARRSAIALILPVPDGRDPRPGRPLPSASVTRPVTAASRGSRRCSRRGRRRRRSTTLAGCSGGYRPARPGDAVAGRRRGRRSNTRRRRGRAPGVRPPSRLRVIDARRSACPTAASRDRCPRGARCRTRRE